MDSAWGDPGVPAKSSHFGFLLLLVILAASLGAATALSYRNAVETAEALLRGQAMDVALAVEAEARRSNGNAALLQAILEERRGRGVAYAALVDPRGAILAHTNPHLAGGRLEDPRLTAAAATDRVQTARAELQTGEEVFEATIPIHGAAAGRAPWVLRVALHAGVAERGVRYAQVQAVGVAALLAALAVLSVRQLRAARRAVVLERLAALGEMAAVLAHEIRNPLGAIKGLAQVLDERAAPASPDHELTETMVRETVRLERLVADLLAYARPRPPDRSAVDVAALLRQAAGFLAGEAAAAGVRIVVESPAAPATAWADAGQLTQLFTNLLLNAVQAMPEGGTARVAMGGDATTLRVWVADEGPGIPPEAAARLFEPFFTTKTRGTGLGLAIGRRIAEAHGGGIGVEARGGSGTRLRVDLPRAAPAAPAAADNSTHIAGGERASRLRTGAIS
jgi:two-component system sensor histidine kinase HydH